MNASKERIAAKDLARVFAGASRVEVAKGKRIETFTFGAEGFDQQAFAAAVLGPTGNLRAPALRVGRHWLVGFHADAYAARLG